MGWAGFQELFQRKDRFDIRLLARDSKKNRKILGAYLNDPSVTVIWGDLTRYEDVLQAISTTGKLEADTEERLKEALTQLLAEVA